MSDAHKQMQEPTREEEDIHDEEEAKEEEQVRAGASSSSRQVGPQQLLSQGQEAIEEKIVKLSAEGSRKHRQEEKRTRKKKKKKKKRRRKKKEEEVQRQPGSHLVGTFIPVGRMTTSEDSCISSVTRELPDIHDGVPLYPSVSETLRVSQEQEQEELFSVKEEQLSCLEEENIDANKTLPEEGGDPAPEAPKSTEERMFSVRDGPEAKKAHRSDGGSVSDEIPPRRSTNASEDTSQVVPGAHASSGPISFHRGEPEGRQRLVSQLPPGSSTAVDSNDENFDSTNLVQARMIPIEDQDLAQAEPVEENDIEQQRQQRHKTCRDGIDWSSKKCKVILAVFIVLLLAVIVILSVSFGVRSQKDNRGPANADQGSRGNSHSSVANTSTPEAYLWSILPEATRNRTLMAAPNSSMEPSSAQGLAFQWLSRDPRLLNYTHLQVLQRFALATFFHATGGYFWRRRSHWLSHNHHECDWYAGDLLLTMEGKLLAESPCAGTSDSKDDATTSGSIHIKTDLVYERLWMMDNNLTGTLPEEIYEHMTHLKSINLAVNHGLMGTISREIHRLSNLTHFTGVETFLSGAIPSQIGFLSNLRMLSLSKRKETKLLAVANSNVGLLRGGLPTQIGRLMALEHLSLFQNQISSELPTELGLLTNLKRLMIHANSLTGHIPSELGKLSSSLQTIYLYDNDLAHTIPTVFGRLGNLTVLQLYRNSLSGSIPWELGELTALQELMLSENALVGSLPTSLEGEFLLGRLTNLRMLYLSHNPQLKGMFPVEAVVSNLTQLQTLDINGTSIEWSGNLSDPILERALNLSFWRYYYDCDRKFPCGVSYQT